MGNFPNLSQLFGEQSMLAPQLGLDQFNQAQNGEMLDQAKGLQDMFLNHEMNPLKLQQRQLENEQIPVQTQGFMLDNQGKEYNNQFTRDTQAGKITATNAENSIKPEEIAQKKAMLQAEAWLRDPNPAVRKLGEDIIQHSKSVLEDKYKEGYKADRQLGVVRETGNQARLTQREGMEGGRYAKAGSRGAAAADFWGSFYKLKEPRQQWAALNAEAARLAAVDPVENQEEITKLRAMAAAVKNSAAAQLRTQGTPGAINYDALLEPGSTNPNVNIDPQDPSVPTAAPAPQGKTYSLDQLKQLYPGVDEGELRQAAQAKGITIK